MVYSPHQVPYSASIEGCRIIATNMSELWVGRPYVNVVSDKYVS